MYIDSIYDRESDRILIAERVNGKRILRRELPEYVFYYTDPRGKHRSIFDDPVSKFSGHEMKKFRGALAKKREEPGIKIFESDINPVFRYLANNYMGAEPPVPHVCFFDIEVDFDAERGYAPTDDPYSPVTAISFYMSHTGVLHTLVLCPPTFTPTQAQAVVSGFPDTILYDDEAKLLLDFLTMTEDADLTSSWNGSGYDIPYLVNRVHLILGEEATKLFCLWDQKPQEREYVKFGRKFKTYETVGRVHLDYLLLYQKHNTQQQHSYRLDFIGEIEVGDHKVPYEGTLDDLYKKDFARFIEYSRQDVALLVKIDQKKKFIDLANQIAHDNCILFKTTMGTVAFVEQAIINEMHKFGYVVPDRKPRPEGDEGDDGEHTPVAGAYVAKPKVGLHSHVAVADINSLYPSAIRALNMSPETIVAQIRPDETMALIEKRIAAGTPRAEAWEGIFAILEVDHMHARDDHKLIIDFEGGQTFEMTGAELYDYVFAPRNHLCVTANGTLFRTDKEGMIPRLLTGWYAKRKNFQKEKEKATLTLATSNGEDDVDIRKLISFYDQRQYATKIILNAAYGALLAPSCRFYDERLGQSTTLSGRTIVRHMASMINETICGEYDHLGNSVVYGDTDSVIFSCFEDHKIMDQFSDLDPTRENIIALYDEVAEITNQTFPDFMARTFNTSPERGALIRAGRELVGSTGLFIKKKKYAILIYDLEGTRMDIAKDGTLLPGKLKAMGLDLKRADTPKYMQEFLQKLLMDVLQGKDQLGMYRDIKAFRNIFTTKPGWEKGSPKKVSNLSKFANLLTKANAVGVNQKGGNFRINMPGHARASINWNALCEMNRDRYSQRITDGTRIIVCKLKPNAMKMDSVAYPIDEPHIPPWFKELPFDHAGMENVVIDSKIINLVGGLGWDLNETKDNPGEEFFSFGEAKKEVDPQLGHNGGPEWDEDDDD